VEQPTDRVPAPGAPGNGQRADPPPQPPARADETAEMLALNDVDDPVARVASPSFPAARRGYDRAAVDAYVQDVSQLVAELHAQRSPRAAVKRALDRVGEETASILQRAHATAEEIAARSRARAEERIQEAETEADRIRAAAEERVRQLDRDTEEIWRERRRLLDDMRATADRLREAAEEAAGRFPAEGEPPLAAPAAAARVKAARAPAQQAPGPAQPTPVPAKPPGPAQQPPGPAKEPPDTAKPPPEAAKPAPSQGQPGPSEPGG
jgi:cell division septum initiation protein DivIVA